MPAWKVLLILVLALASLGLAMATVVVTLLLSGEENRWLWSGGLLLACIGMSTLLTLFLRREDRALMQENARRGYR
jgi:hypothetical protein